MRIKIFSCITFVVCFCITNRLLSQSCINSDLESSIAGNYTTSLAISGWTLNGGTNNIASGSCNLTGCCPTNPSQSQIISTSSGHIDPYIGSSYPIYSVFGPLVNVSFGYGDYILKLNDGTPNFGINSASKTISVTPSSLYFQYAYIAVLQNSTHSCCDAPLFKVRLRNASSGNTIIPHPQFSVSATSSCTGLSCGSYTSATLACPLNPQFRYNKWAVNTIDLSAYLGSSITVEFIMSDCTVGDHAGYVYLDTECTSLKTIANGNPIVGNPVTVSSCGSSSVSLTAPNWVGPYLWNGSGCTVGTSTFATFVTYITCACGLIISPPGSCSTITQTFNIIATSPPSVSLTVSSNSVCLGSGAITLSGSPSGGAYSGANVSGNQFTPSSTGTFMATYSYTDTNNCSAAANTNIIVSNCTGINELGMNSNNINLYPQPAEDLININFNYTNEKSISIFVYDLNGKIILVNEKIELKNNTAKFNTSSFSNGIYILQIKYALGNSVSKRLVIAK